MTLEIVRTLDNYATVHQPHFIGPFAAGVESDLVSFRVCFLYGGRESLVAVRDLRIQSSLGSLRAVRYNCTYIV